jgi:hypothetical protein
MKMQSWNQPLTFQCLWLTGQLSLLGDTFTFIMPLFDFGFLFVQGYLTSIIWRLKSIGLIDMYVRSKHFRSNWNTTKTVTGKKYYIDSCVLFKFITAFEALAVKQCRLSCNISSHLMNNLQKWVKSVECEAMAAKASLKLGASTSIHSRMGRTSRTKGRRIKEAIYFLCVDLILRPIIYIDVWR